MNNNLSKIREALEMAHTKSRSLEDIFKYTQALTLLTEIERDGDWRTMDSAPRDGRYILLHRARKRRGTPMKTDIVQAKWSGNCWVALNSHHARDDRFTGWQPLPNPPGHLKGSE